MRNEQSCDMDRVGDILNETPYLLWRRVFFNVVLRVSFLQRYLTESVINYSRYIYAEFVGLLHWRVLLYR